MGNRRLGAAARSQWSMFNGCELSFSVFRDQSQGSRVVSNFHIVLFYSRRG